MSVRIVENTVGPRHRAADIEQAVCEGIGDRPGQFDVVINGLTNTSAFLVKIDGPDRPWQGELSSPEERDLNCVRNTVECGLSRDIPIKVTVLFDDCIGQGTTRLGMNGPTPIQLKYGLREGYSCCNPQYARHYVTPIGYFSVGRDGMPARVRNQPCGKCEGETGMYIEAVVERKNVRYRCPACKAYRPKPVPPAI